MDEAGIDLLWQNFLQNVFKIFVEAIMHLKTFGTNWMWYKLVKSDNQQMIRKSEVKSLFER